MKLFFILLLTLPLNICAQNCKNIEVKLLSDNQGFLHDSQGLLTTEDEIFTYKNCKDLIEKPVLFPNPCTDYFEVKGIRDKEGIVYDYAGRYMKRVELLHDVDINELSNGFYLLRTANHIFKFIKQ